MPVGSVLNLNYRVASGKARDERAGAPSLPGRTFAGLQVMGAGQSPTDRAKPPGSDAGRSGPAAPDQSDLLGFLAISFMAGLFALLTPCVCPMIPVTIAFFTKHAEVSRKRSIIMAGT